MYRVAIRDDIRTWVLMQGNSQRSAARKFGISRDTVARMLQESPETAQRRYKRAVVRSTPVTKTIRPHVQSWLEENEQLRPWARKQQWTAHRMWVELGRMGIAVGESTVRQLVRTRKRAHKPAFVPLAFGPGERAEFDFGHAYVILNGQKLRFPYFAGRLRFSGADFVEFIPTERQDAFLLGQRHAFEFWCGVPQHAVFDNTSAAVKLILKGHARVETAAFHHFHSAYLFEAVFANPGSGWEKGSVENLVGTARRIWRPLKPNTGSRSSSATTTSSIGSRSTNWATCRSPDSPPSCCSSSFRTAMSGAASASRPTLISPAGPRFSVMNR